MYTYNMKNACAIGKQVDRHSKFQRNGKKSECIRICATDGFGTLTAKIVIRIVTSVTIINDLCAI